MSRVCFIRLFSVSERLPEVPKTKLALDGLVFVVDGRMHYGYYHVNGCFYERGGGVGPVAASPASKASCVTKKATEWGYFQEVGENSTAC